LVDAATQRSCAFLISNGGTQYVAYFFFHAPTMAD
jgi:hypothetical protein